MEKHPKKPSKTLKFGKNWGAKNTLWCEIRSIFLQYYKIDIDYCFNILNLLYNNLKNKLVGWEIII